MIDRIAKGRTDLVFEYLAKGHPSTFKDSNGVSLLEWCAYYGDVSAIRHLLEHGETLVSLGDNLDLNGAAFHGYWRLCGFLLENGADPNKPHESNGETPLHVSLCKANRPAYDSVVKILLKAGANPNVVTKPLAPTDCFMRDARTKAETPLHRAAAFGSEEAIRALKEAGARLDAKDMNGDSPLSWGSWHLRPDAILRMLCYDGFSIHPQRRSTFDHGMGWGTMELSLHGSPAD